MKKTTKSSSTKKKSSTKAAPPGFQPNPSAAPAVVNPVEIFRGKMPANSVPTAEHVAGIAQLVYAGVTPEIAAANVGIRRQTFAQWMHIGYADQLAGLDTAFARFFHAMEAIQARDEALMSEAFMKGRNNYQQLLSVLERKYPARWSVRQQMMMGGTSDSLLSTDDPTTGGANELGQDEKLSIIAALDDLGYFESNNAKPEAVRDNGQDEEASEAV